MAQALTKTVARLRELAARPYPGERTDRQLLEAFARCGDESAFTLLVHRHGSLVLGVCRRVLGNAADAEDAFQATFLVLARKADKVAWHESVRNWLYGVAHRIARKARMLQARRAQKEREAGTAEKSSALESAWAEVRGVLDEELHNLPAKYRAPLLLCCLDGKTREEAAAELGWSVGSVKGRLERGREMLRERLRGRGLTLSGSCAPASCPKHLCRPRSSKARRPPPSPTPPAPWPRRPLPSPFNLHKELCKPC